MTTSKTDNVVKLADQGELAKARETLSKVVVPDLPAEIIARAYMRLQCADVPREPWHWEVCQILQTPQVPPSEPREVQRLRAALAARVAECDRLEKLCADTARTFMTAGRQLERAVLLEDVVNDDPYMTAAEIIYLRDRNANLEKVAKLASDMLAMLKALVTADDDGDLSFDDINEARELITKGEGKL